MHGLDDLALHNDLKPEAGKSKIHENVNITAIDLEGAKQVKSGVMKGKGNGKGNGKMKEVDVDKLTTLTSFGIARPGSISNNNCNASLSNNKNSLMNGCNPESILVLDKYGIGTSRSVTFDSHSRSSDDGDDEVTVTSTTNTSGNTSKNKKSIKSKTKHSSMLASDQDCDTGHIKTTSKTQRSTAKFSGDNEDFKHSPYASSLDPQLHSQAASITRSTSRSRYRVNYNENLNPNLNNEIPSTTNLQTIKNLLTDDEKFAYIRLVKISMLNMATGLAQLIIKSSSSPISSSFSSSSSSSLLNTNASTNTNIKRSKSTSTKTNSKKFPKRLSGSQNSMARWSQITMNNLYKHMEFTKEKIKIIERLNCDNGEIEELILFLMGSRSSNSDTTTNNNNDNIDKPSSIKTKEEESNLIDFNSNADDDEIINKIDKRINDNDDPKIDIRWTILCDLFLVLLSESIYDSRSRTLLKAIAYSLKISEHEISKFEKKITDSLDLESELESGINSNIDNDLNDYSYTNRQHVNIDIELEQHQRLQEQEQQKWSNNTNAINIRRLKTQKKSYLMVGLATIGGGLVIGLSAGLLAPVIGAGLAAGLTTIGVSGTGTFLAGTGGAAIVTTAGTAVGAHIGGKGMFVRTGYVKTFQFQPLLNHKRVNLIITVSGWTIGKDDDIRLPFSTVDPIMGDIVSLLWEPTMLRSMGESINIVATEVLTNSVQQILGQTILIALMSSIQLPMALTKLSYLLDNPWSVSLDRAWSTGLILADTLMAKSLGARPVTLVGFSLGARVIYSCLLELSKKGAYGLIENVYLFGSPLVVNREKYTLAKSVVSGRFVNGFSKTDWILGYLFRATSGGLGKIGGLGPIKGVYGVENFDCSRFVSGHMGYREAMPVILKHLGWEVTSEEFGEADHEQTAEFDIQRQKQKELIQELEEAKKTLEKELKNKEKKGKRGFWDWMIPSKKKEKEWWDMYQKDGQEHGSNAGSTSNRRSSISSVCSTDGLFDRDALLNEIEELRANGDLEPSKFQPQNPIEDAPKNQLPIAKLSNFNDNLMNLYDSENPSSSSSLSSFSSTKNIKHIQLSIPTHVQARSNSRISIDSYGPLTVPAPSGSDIPYPTAIVNSNSFPGVGVISPSNLSPFDKLHQHNNDCIEETIAYINKHHSK